MKHKKILCFTNSYHRPYQLYNTIAGILNQTYKYLHYVVGISIDHKDEEQQYLNLLSDFINDKRLKLFFHKNLSQHDNYLFPIKQTNYRKYDLFAKIDDDDIYKKTYIEHNVNELKNTDADIISSNICYQINNHKIYHGLFDNVGGYWHGDLSSNIKFGMPFSYIFNLKCLDILLNTTSEELKSIHPFEDPGWRTKWRENNIKSYVINDLDLAIYNIHGKNISSSPWLIPDNRTIFDSDIFTVCYFKHPYWQSYAVMQKKYNAIYNIYNNDHGVYTVLDDIISVKWDKYTEIENFKKHDIDQQSYMYEYL